MKSRYLFCLLSIAILGSCTEDNELILDNHGVNSWLHKTMKEYYLWSDRIPNIEATDMELSPTNYFNTQLRYRDNSSVYYRDDTYGDRFSRITALSAGAESDSAVSLASDDKVHNFGLGFRTFLNAHDPSQTEFIQITYVIPQSPADLAGIRRGDRFTKINDVQMPTSGSRVTEALAGQQVTITFNYPKLKKVSMTRADYYDTPVIFDSIFGTTPKTAYLVYNHFSVGVSDRYLNELNNVFLKFKNAGAQTLILDMRYNGGGDIRVARHLASLIARKEMLGQPLVYKESRSSYGRQELFSREDFIENVGDIAACNMNAQSIYILTSKNTASASELIIHALKAYYGNQLMVVGETTVGKNVGSTEITNKRYMWQLNPITIRVYDKFHKSGYETGIRANYPVREFSPGSNYDIGNFGDSAHEPLINEALHLIDPQEYALHITPSPMSTRAVAKYHDVVNVPDRGLVTDRIVVY